MRFCFFQYLIELERTRDRLLIDLLRKLGGHSSEMERLKAHFKEVEALSDRLGKPPSSARCPAHWSHHDPLSTRAVAISRNEITEK